MVTPGSNLVFEITLLMDGHGGQGIMKRAVELQKALLEACDSIKAWPKCTQKALQSFQEHARRMRYRGGATLVACFLEDSQGSRAFESDGQEATGRVAFAWAGDSMAVLIREQPLGGLRSREEKNGFPNWSLEF